MDFANNGFNPNGTAADLSLAVAELRLILQSRLGDVQQRMKDTADRYRHAKTPTFSAGDQVYLSTVNINTNRPSKKLDHKRIGPFKVIKQVHSSVYRLDLPSSMKIHPNFHVSLLELATDDLVFKRKQPPPGPVEVHDEPGANEDYEIESIVDSRFHGSKKELQYYAKWKGYSSDYNEWIHHEYINAPNAIKEFHRRHPSKPGPAPKPKGKKKASQ